MALDRARLRPGVDCALDAGHGGVPRMVNITGLELDFNYLPSLNASAYISEKKNSEDGRDEAYGIVVV